MISFIMCTFNRAATIGRAIESVLAQTDPDWELIIVDDGSKDNTQELLKHYSHDPRIRIVKHPENRGVTAAKNTGFDNIMGEWFTTVDSDDEIIPEAIRKFKKVMEFDQEINAIECNCIDTMTGKSFWNGLDHDQYLSLETMVKNCSGEYWGITKTELLHGMRFNEKIRGLETILWFKISKNVKRYYTHEPLLLVHTEGEDRLSKLKSIDIKQRYGFYTEVAKETEYLDLLRKWKPEIYNHTLFYIGLAAIIHDKYSDLRRIIIELIPRDVFRALFLSFGLIFGSKITEKVYRRIQHYRGK
jgi:glycosyltransferase involved in cell wall biosynthesis